MSRSNLLSGCAAALIAFAVSYGVAFFMQPAAASAQDRAVAAEEITVVDAHGTPRVVLRSGPGAGAGVDLLAADGTRRLLLQTGGIRGAAPDSASVNIFRSDGSRAVLLGVQQEYPGGWLTFEDQQGRARLSVALDLEGSPSITMWNPDGSVAWSAP